MVFYEHMESVRDELIKCGHEVKIPELVMEALAEFGGGKKVYFGKYIEENGKGNNRQAHIRRKGVHTGSFLVMSLV